VMESYDGIDSLELDKVVKGGCVREVTRLKVVLLR
jgi:hypothetical protein